MQEPSVGFWVAATSVCFRFCSFCSELQETRRRHRERRHMISRHSVNFIGIPEDFGGCQRESLIWRRGTDHRPTTSHVLVPVERDVRSFSRRQETPEGGAP